jgi:valyl-tRNA synthetase
MNAADHDPDAPGCPALAAPDRWVLKRLGETLTEVDAALSSYRFNDAALALYHFTWSVYCDWYIELSKPALQDPARRPGAQWTLLRVLRDVVKALHPVMPYVTEELWSALPRPSGESEHVVAARYPEPFRTEADPEVERLEALLDVIARVRNIRGETGVGPGQKVDLFVLSDDEGALAPLRAGEEHLVRLGNLGEVTFGDLSARPAISSMAVAGAVEVHVTLPGADLGEEARRLGKEIARIDSELSALEAKLSNPAFVDRAPANVVSDARKRRDDALAAKEKLTASLAKIQGDGK